jgi:hypothetical protein
MFFPVVRSGVVCAAIMCLLIIEYLRVNIELKFTMFDLLVISYIVYNLATIFIYLSSGLPISAYIQEFSNSVLPLIFYFIGRLSDKENKFYDNILYACVFCFIVGFYLYYKLPVYYIAYMARTVNNFSYEYYLLFSRMNSFISSVSIGSLGAISSAICFSFMINKKKGFIKYLLFFIISIYAVILSSQRSAIVVTLIVIIILNIYGRHRKILSRKIFFTELIIFCVMIITVTWLKPGVIETVITRLSTLGNAIGERDNSWIAALKSVDNIFIGKGLASASHKVLSSGIIIVADGSYFKLLAEVGIIGTLIFLYILILTLFRSIKYYKCFYLEICILTIFILQAIGSNVFAFQILAPIFWFSVGKIWNKNSIDNNQLIKNYIKE